QYRQCGATHPKDSSDIDIEGRLPLCVRQILETFTRVANGCIVYDALQRPEGLYRELHCLIDGSLLREVHFKEMQAAGNSRRLSLERATFVSIQTNAQHRGALLGQQSCRRTPNACGRPGNENAFAGD